MLLFPLTNAQMLRIESLSDWIHGIKYEFPFSPFCLKKASE